MPDNDRGHVTNPLFLCQTVQTLQGESDAPLAPASVEELYDHHASYVYRSLRRLGVPQQNLSDALQDVFIVVHRRLRELDPSRSARAWLFVVSLGIARNHRRTLRRKAPESGFVHRADPDHIGGRFEEPLDRAAHAERIETLYRLLDTLDEEKRAVFVLAELEERTVPEIADTLGINLNTAYARLRAARQKFESGLARLKAEEKGRERP